MKSYYRDLCDSELVSAYLAGEDRAFNEIVLRYEGHLLRFVHRSTGDRERSMELVQDVFLRVFKNLHKFEQSESFSGWIYTIAKNVTRTEAKRKKAKPLVLFTDLGRPDKDGNPPRVEFTDPDSRADAELELSDLKDLFTSAVREAPEFLRTALTLRVLKEKSYEAISELTQCKVNTVKSRISRGRSIARETVRFKYR